MCVLVFMTTFSMSPLKFFLLILQFLQNCLKRISLESFSDLDNSGASLSSISHSFDEIWAVEVVLNFCSWHFTAYYHLFTFPSRQWSSIVGPSCCHHPCPTSHHFAVCRSAHHCSYRQQKRQQTQGQPKWTYTSMYNLVDLGNLKGKHSKLTKLY